MATSTTRRGGRGPTGVGSCKSWTWRRTPWPRCGPRGSPRIGLEQAATIGALASSPSPAVREAAASPEVQQQLLDLAEGMDADAFADEMARWAATVDPPQLERDHQAQRRERYLHLTHSTDGTHVKGFLDAVAGHNL